MKQEERSKQAEHERHSELFEHFYFISSQQQQQQQQQQMIQMLQVQQQAMLVYWPDLSTNKRKTKFVHLY